MFLMMLKKLAMFSFSKNEAFLSGTFLLAKMFIVINSYCMFAVKLKVCGLADRLWDAVRRLQYIRIEQPQKPGNKELRPGIPPVRGAGWCGYINHTCSYFCLV